MAKPIAAICYDFDSTLSPGNMQEYNFIPRLGVSPEEFWRRAGEISREGDADRILSYMFLMLDSAKSQKITVRREDFREFGRGIKFFPGVKGWFQRINAFGAALGLQVEHYIISSGLREMIEGTDIAEEFAHIYASSFLYDEYGAAVWPALAVNYTTKTQFLFRVNKGVLDIWDDEGVNRYTPDRARRVPFRNMLFLGDGDTDVPCMKLVKVNGGHSIAVYPAEGNASAALQYVREERCDCIAPADYGSGRLLDRSVKEILKGIAAREALLAFHAREDDL